MGWSKQASWVLAATMTLAALACRGTDGRGHADSGGGDAGADGDADTDAAADADSEPVPLDLPLEQFLVSGFGSLRTEEAYSYSIDFDLTATPIAVAAEFSAGLTEPRQCSGQAELTSEQEAELEQVLAAIRTCRITPGGTEFCDMHTVQFFGRRGSAEDSITVLKADTGCSFIDLVLCAGGPELYRFVASVVTVESPADCPADYLDVLDE